jgi:hypothetical protein
MEKDLGLDSGNVEPGLAKVLVTVAAIVAEIAVRMCRLCRSSAKLERLRCEYTGLQHWLIGSRVAVWGRMLVGAMQFADEADLLLSHITACSQHLCTQRHCMLCNTSVVVCHSEWTAARAGSAVA